MLQDRSSLDFKLLSGRNSSVSVHIEMKENIFENTAVHN